MDKEIIGVLGAGTMGQGIAQVAAGCHHKVYLYDAYPDQLGKARHTLRTTMQRQVEKDRMLQQEVDDIMNRIHFADDLTGYGRCDLAVEAVVEDLEIKQDVFRRLEGIVSRDCILATNTSSLSIASLSSVLKKPGRFLGTHFFNPAPQMPLVEIVPGISTSAGTVKKTRRLLGSWKDHTVLAKDTPGFIVNRVARPFFGEALRQLEEGVADVSTIDWAMKEIGGFKRGPFQLMDFIGNDINYKVTVTIFEEFFYDPRFKPSLIQQRMVEAGHLGRKSGKGFYEYGDNEKEQVPTKDRDVGQQIVNRILTMLINEAADVVFMNIAAAKEVDLAMTKGVPFPKGPLEWADDLGLMNVLDRLTGLQTEYREDRYRPNPLLKKMVRNNETFYG